MFKMSTRSTYAVRALIQLGRNAGASPVRLSQIAEAQNIPLPYLEQIFARLKRAGLVQAVRGPQGGYQLSRGADAITMAEIISVLEGPVGPLLCSMPENKTPDCHEVEGCVSRLLCAELDGEVTKILSRNTLATLCGRADSAHASKNAAAYMKGAVDFNG